MKPYSRQQIDEDDIEAVTSILRSPMLTQGPAVEQFEKDVCAAVNARFGVAMNSATSALHAACKALSVSERDTVWVSPISFAATANCALYCGANVDFVDIDPDTYNMSTKALWDKLQTSKNKPNFLIVTHMAGMPANMKEIRTFARTVGVRVIEDAAHAFGARYDEKTPVGSCKYSDITVFSFHPVKPITTGEGGMAVTNDPEIAEYMQAFRSHGMLNGHQYLLGYNYRMTDMAAALGSSQVRKAETFIKIRKELAMRYFDELHSHVRQQPISLTAHSAHHLHIITHPNAEGIREALKQAGYHSPLHYRPIYSHPYYSIRMQKMGTRPEMFPEAERYAKEAVSLPLHQQLTHQEQEEVISIVKANT